MNMTIDTSPIPALPPPSSEAEAEARQLAVQFIEERLEKVLSYGNAALNLSDAGDLEGMIYCCRCVAGNAKYMATAVKRLYDTTAAGAPGGDA